MVHRSAKDHQAPLLSGVALDRIRALCKRTLQAPLLTGILIAQSINATGLRLIAILGRICYYYLSCSKEAVGFQSRGCFWKWNEVSVVSDVWVDPAALF